MNQSVSIQVDQSALIGHLRNFFATSYTFLTELMQNARRAGASEVRFTFDKVNDVIIVEDNGSGIEDMQNLLTFAKSGWDESVVEADKPFGMGFFAAIFAAEVCTVESRGQRLHFRRDELIAGRPAQVTAGEREIGTCITLSGFNDEFGFSKCEERISLAARGFPIRIFVGGAEQPRPNARANLQGVETELGFMSLPGIHRPGRVSRRSSPLLYLQGLPIGFFGRYKDDEEITVHLDSSKVNPKLPDRDHLVDEDAVFAKLAELREVEVEKFLREQRAALGAYAFAGRYFEDCRALDLDDLLADLPVPNRYFEEYDPDNADPYEGRFFTRNAESAPTFVTPEDIAAGLTPVLIETCTDPGDDTFAFGIFLRERGLPIVDDDLPRSSWLWNHVTDLGDVELEIEPVNPKQGRFSGECLYCMVVVCDEVIMRVVDHPELGEVRISDPAFGFGDTLYVPKGSTDLGYAMLHIDGMRSENGGDFVDSELMDRDYRELTHFIGVLEGADPVESIKRALDKANVDSLPNMEGIYIVKIEKREGDTTGGRVFTDITVERAGAQ